LLSSYWWGCRSMCVTASVGTLSTNNLFLSSSDSWAS